MWEKNNRHDFRYAYEIVIITACALVDRQHISIYIFFQPSCKHSFLVVIFDLKAIVTSFYITLTPVNILSSYTTCLSTSPNQTMKNIRVFEWQHFNFMRHHSNGKSHYGWLLSKLAVECLLILQWKHVAFCLLRTRIRSFRHILLIFIQKCKYTVMGFFFESKLSDDVRCEIKYFLKKFRMEIYVGLRRFFWEKLHFLLKSRGDHDQELSTTHVLVASLQCDLWCQMNSINFLRSVTFADSH